MNLIGVSLLSHDSLCSLIAAISLQHNWQTSVSFPKTVYQNHILKETLTPILTTSILQQQVHPSDSHRLESTLDDLDTSQESFLAATTRPSLQMLRQSTQSLEVPLLRLLRVLRSGRKECKVRGAVVDFGVVNRRGHVLAETVGVDELPTAFEAKWAAKAWWSGLLVR